MLQAGFSSIVISPPKGIFLAGYGVPERDNVGIHDDLMAKAILMDDGQKKILIITADLIGMGNENVMKIRKEAIKHVPLEEDAILVACSHTHSGPILADRDDHKVPPEYPEGLIRKMGALVKEAAENLAPVKIGLGIGEVDLAHNRRIVDPQTGKATNEWDDPGKKHTGLVDKRVFAVKLEDCSGNVKAALVNYACHPVTMGAANKKVSADYPGAMRKHVENAFPGAMALFTNAGGANIDPYICVGNDFKPVEDMGRTLGAEVVRVLKATTTEEADSLAFHRLPVSLDPRPELADQYKDTDGKIITEMQLLRIGDMVIVTAPGELLIEIAHMFKQASPYDRTLVFAYANDSIGYLPSDAVMKEGGYEVSRSRSAHIEQPLVDTFKKGLGRIRRPDPVPV